MLNTADLSTERLLFRRQFVMGPSFAVTLPGWRRLSVRSRLHLTMHPDLHALQVSDGARSLTLLGYLLDPVAPAAGDDGIVRRLLGRLAHGGWRAFIGATADLGGRWILIADDGIRVRLLTDPCGFRQVVFTDPRGAHGLWCASQPGLLAELLGGLEPAPEAMDFVRRYRETVPGWRGAEYWWPGDTTGYREIRHLLPNHYLDLTNGGVHRFWPDAELGHLSVTDAVERNAVLLRGIIESAARRYDLALALTAGRDTRLLLAAARPVARRMLYFTLKHWDRNDESADLVVPRRLAARLGLNHHVIECPAAMDLWFAHYYMRNVSGAHEAYGAIAQGLWHEYPQEHLFVKGNASFVMHNFDRFRHEHPHGRPIGLEALQRFSKVGDYPFAAEATLRWWECAGNIHNVDLVSLFHWETKEGKWQSTAQLEWDIVQDVLVLYNCRSFMSNALAVHHRFRDGPTHYLQRSLTAALWPEVLSEPINSVSWRGGTMRRSVRDFLVRRDLYKYVRRVRDRSRRDSAG